MHQNNIYNITRRLTLVKSISENNLSNDNIFS